MNNFTLTDGNAYSLNKQLATVLIDKEDINDQYLENFIIVKNNITSSSDVALRKKDLILHKMTNMNEYVIPSSVYFSQNLGNINNYFGLETQFFYLYLSFKKKSFLKKIFLPQTDRQKWFLNITASQHTKGSSYKDILNISNKRSSINPGIYFSLYNKDYLIDKRYLTEEEIFKNDEYFYNNEEQTDNFRTPIIPFYWNRNFTQKPIIFQVIAEDLVDISTDKNLYINRYYNGSLDSNKRIITENGWNISSIDDSYCSIFW